VYIILSLKIGWKLLKTLTGKSGKGLIKSFKRRFRRYTLIELPPFKSEEERTNRIPRKHR